MTRAAAPITAAPAGPLAGTGPPAPAPPRAGPGVARHPGEEPEYHTELQAGALVPQRDRFDDRDAVGGVGPERPAALRRGRELVRLAVVEPGARVVRAIGEGVGPPVERVPRVDAERAAV